jgi:RNA polymerase sigma factor (sigma-70 family)
MALANCLVAGGTSPSRRAIREELRQRVRAALDEMVSHDREILVMWHLEQLSASEIAAVLQMTEAGVKSRHRRALQRLMCNLEGDVDVTET